MSSFSIGVNFPGYDKTSIIGREDTELSTSFFIRDNAMRAICSVFAEAGGVILYQTISLGIEKGKPMIAYGELTEEG